MNVSVVIPTYNDAEYIKSALQSVQSSAVAEIIVIDDNSTDTTISTLKNEQLVSNFTLLENVQNSGPSVSRNKGIVAAKSKWIAFLDGDDYWLPKRLEKMIAMVEQNPSIDIVFSDALIEQDGAMTDTRQSSLMPIPESTDNIREYLFKRNCINMCAVLIKTSLAKKILFDETLRSAEDYDFWIRVAATNSVFKYTSEPLVVYRKYGKSLSDRRLHSIAATLSVLKKNEELARTELARENLALHRISLYEEQLHLAEDKNLILKSLREIRNLRQLGKRERILQSIAQHTSSLSELARNILIREGKS